MKYRTADGRTVETVRLSAARAGDGDWLRIKRASGHVLGMVRTVGELARYGIDLADLTEES